MAVAVAVAVAVVTALCCTIAAGPGTPRVAGLGGLDRGGGRLAS